MLFGFDGICFCLHWLLGESSHKLDFHVKADHAYLLI